MKRLIIGLVVFLMALCSCFEDECSDKNNEKCEGNVLYVCDDYDNEWFSVGDCKDFGKACIETDATADCI